MGLFTNLIKPKHAAHFPIRLRNCSFGVFLIEFFLELLRVLMPDLNKTNFLLLQLLNILHQKGKVYQDYEQQTMKTEVSFVYEFTLILASISVTKFSYLILLFIAIKRFGFVGN